jgi:hypothetical protein
LIVAPDADDNSRPNYLAYKIVKDHKLLKLRSIPDLSVRTGSQSGFKLDGRLSKTCSCAIVWIDTRGKFSVVEIISGREFSYPTGSNFVTVDPTDPIGAHLVLVLTEETTDGAAAVSNRPRSKADPLAALRELPPDHWPLPPNVPNAVWTSFVAAGSSTSELTTVWRGPTVIQHESETSYLEQIESRLPPGVRPLAAFFLTTTNAQGG